MRITAKGQITIPQDIREEAGLLPHTEVEFVVEPDGVRIIKVRNTRKAMRGALLVDKLRRSRGQVTMSTDEIMAHSRGEK
jgi:AbrB family looped-hinge helix DNA binding protein